MSSSGAENPHSQHLSPQQGTKAREGEGQKRKREGVGLGASERLPSCPGGPRGRPLSPSLQLSRDGVLGAQTLPPLLSSPPTVAPSTPAPSGFRVFRVGLYFVFTSSALTSRSSHRHPRGCCVCLFSFPLSAQPSPSSSLPLLPPSLCSPSFPVFFYAPSLAGLQQPVVPGLLSSGSPASLGPAEPGGRGVTPKPCGDPVPRSGPPNPPRYTRGGGRPRKASDGPKAHEHCPRPPTPPGAPTHCPD